MDQSELEVLLSYPYMARQILTIHRMIDRNVRQREDLAFRRLGMRLDGQTKTLTSIDHRAEADFIDALTTRFGKDDIFVIGEESLLEGLDLSGRRQICVLIDMIDGTDLLERKMSNWCSAVVVFSPQDRSIEGAYVALPDDQVLYFATRYQPGAYKVSLTRADESEPEPLTELNTAITLLNASICIYGQKSSSMLHLLSLHENDKFTSWLRNLGSMEREYRTARSMQEVNFRFYNLAGNPMMVRLAEGYFDIVVEPAGQYPHDMAAGVFIAVKAGAVLTNETGEPLELTEIADALCRPADSRVKYILAANEQLGKEMAELLRP